MKTITYDDTLYQIVPKEATEIWCDGLLMSGYFSAHATRRVQLRHCKELISAVLTCSPRVPTPPAQPEAKSNEWTLIAPDGTRFTGPSPGKTAIEASKHHMETDPEAREKFLRAIKQIAEEGRQEREQCMRDYGTLDCPHCGGSGHIADAVANGHAPQPEAVRVPLTDEHIEAIADRFTRKLGGDHWYKGEDGIADYEGFARAIEAAHGITAAAPKQEPGA